MKRSDIFAVIFAALLCNQASAQQAKKAKNPLAGTWLLVGMEQQGHAVPQEQVPLGVLRYDDNSVTIVMWDMQCKATVTIDSDAKPSTIDAMHTDGTHKGQKQHAIYKIQGDQLVFCGSAPGAPPEKRPKGFMSGEGNVVMKFRKVKQPAKLDKSI